MLLRQFLRDYTLYTAPNVVKLDMTKVVKIQLISLEREIMIITQVMIKGPRTHLMGFWPPFPTIGHTQVVVLSVMNKSPHGHKSDTEGRTKYEGVENE